MAAPFCRERTLMVSDGARTRRDGAVHPVGGNVCGGVEAVASARSFWGSPRNSLLRSSRRNERP